MKTEQIAYKNPLDIVLVESDSGRVFVVNREALGSNEYLGHLEELDLDRYREGL